MPIKYYINNVPLKEWCHINNFPYNTACSYFRKHNNITEQELINHLKRVKKKKYFYKGIPLYNYCKDNNLEYYKYLRRIEELIKKEKLSEEEAVIKAIESYTDSRCNFYYQGMSLKRYCDINGYNYQKIYKRIKDDTDLDVINKKIKDFLEDDPKCYRENYKINGLTLRAYCKKNNYIYPTIKTYVQNIIRENPNIPRNEAAMKAIEYYKKNHCFKEKWFYHGQRLVDYCKKNNFNYNSIVSYLLKYAKDPKNITEEEMDIAKKKHAMWLRKKAFSLLQNAKSLEECSEIINTLNIDIDSILLIMAYNLNFKQAIYFAWYFGLESNKKIIIDKNRIEEVLSNLNNIRKLELNELIGYYKAKLFDTRDIIYERTFLAIKKIVADMSKLYNIKKQSERNDLASQANLLLLNYIEQSNSRYIGQIINHMNKSIKWYLHKYITKELKSNTLSLNSEKYEKKEMIEYITDKKQNIDSEYFSSELKSIIKDLESDEISYIVLRYQKQFENYEISKIMQKSIDELEELDNTLIEKLRNNNSIKKLIRR